MCYVSLPIFIWLCEALEKCVVTYPVIRHNVTLSGRSCDKKFFPFS